MALRPRWRWLGWQDGAARFATPEGPRAVDACATVLALGGASWPRLGSDGAWAAILAAEGVELAPFRPSNVGFRVAWSAAMARHFGAPVKPVRLAAGGAAVAGEFVVTARGRRGRRHLRARPPAAGRRARSRSTSPRTAAKATSPPASPGRAAAPRSPTTCARRSASARSRSRSCASSPRRRSASPAATAAALKALPLPLAGPLPLDEAISTAGGVARAALDDGLMLRARPGVFCAGEMLDWDAPTGGYLLTACLATGRHAGRAAARWPAGQ